MSYYGQQQQYYYQTSAAENVPLVQDVRDDQGAVRVAFDRTGGYNYLCLLPSLIVPCFAPLFALGSRKYIASQQCQINDRRVEFESGWLNRSHKSIPLDRIQDVNVRQDCLQACFGIHTIEIQTAGTGGGIEPEATLIAPVDAMMVRDAIMDRRDAIVLSHHTVQAAQKPLDNATVVEELQSINASLARLEAHIEAGVNHLTKHKTDAPPSLL